MATGKPRNPEIQKVVESTGIKYHSAYVRQWRVTDKTRRQKRAESRRKYAIKYKYGLTVKEYDAKLASQEGKCAICNDQAKLVLDHNHVTKKTRQFICTPCNLMIGHAKERKEILIAAVKYLENHAQG